jgi:hypothetical protein
MMRIAKIADEEGGALEIGPDDAGAAEAGGSLSPRGRGGGGSLRGRGGEAIGRGAFEITLYAPLSAAEPSVGSDGGRADSEASASLAAKPGFERRFGIGGGWLNGAVAPLATMGSGATPALSRLGVPSAE